LDLTTSARTNERFCTVDGVEFDETWDVVVLGVGAAGAAAALAAHESGARTLVVEKCPPESAGGNTRVSGGGWFINIDTERAGTFLRSLNGSRPVAPDVVEAWAQETARNSDWMRALGAGVEQSMQYHVTAEYGELDGADCYGGMDTVDGRMGRSLLYNFLVGALVDRGIEIRFNSRATELIADDGQVRGVRVDSSGNISSVQALGGVVLATGGFAANPSMVRDYLRLDEHVLWGSPHTTGDGHRMAQQIGADLWHMDNMMTITGVDTGNGSGVMLAPWNGKNFVYVGPDGRRLVDESKGSRHGHVQRNGHEELFPLTPFFMIFDETMRTAGPVTATEEILPVGWKILMDGFDWSPDNSAEVADGTIHRADSLEQLAAVVDIDPDVLVRSVESYNAGCHAGRDDHFGRNSNTLAPVTTGPYYALRIVPLLGWSNGGPRRDGQSRVLDTRGEVIAGLYAAGEASSTYSWTKDGGLHVADALAFGRIAGHHAAGRLNDPSSFAEVQRNTTRS
jgi:succinate dehydrogenase/fumarate reductase flavoprotein subunit